MGEARTSHKKPQKNQPQFDARTECYRVLGVDLTAMPGVETPTALVFLCELGPGFAEKFATAKHFASWLGLCPDHRITGGKIMSSKTRAVKSRVATALRLAAQSLCRARNYFGDLYRRWKARLGNQKAVTAMAHKLARVLWHLRQIQASLRLESVRKRGSENEKKLTRLQNMAASLNLQLVPLQWLARLVSQEAAGCDSRLK